MENNKIPIYYADIDMELKGIELKGQGIQNLALVEEPAMLKEWLMFSEQKPYEFKMAIQEEQRIIVAPIIVANLPIKRIEEKNGVMHEFYVVYKKDINMKILQKYMMDGNHKKAKLTHETEDLLKGVFVFEVFMSDESRGILQPKGFNLPDGTIFCSMKINNEDTWSKIKSGEVKGISLEGLFNLEKSTSLTDSQFKAIIDAVIS